ncbi:putative MFS-type transporter C18.02 [Tolypocladium ophioglossoides CBS 100239]|uniref:Putative MFS-type transporter C18.02 n=1 Tax=Tolypocladium ophioglossoides (strain CBS 100239) TaxID=1163406 RepID=A0A0L0NFI4_TOLOC|nr:putative MFS-type transporter C18.02 [Tolypocladium ophioglossoides CBS 100239]
MWSKVTRQGKRPILLGLRSSTTLIVFTVAMAIFTDLFPYAVVVPVMPFALPERAGVPPDEGEGPCLGAVLDVNLSRCIRCRDIGILTYVVHLRRLAPSPRLTCSTALWGYLADRIQNRRTLMIAGLFLLAASTLLLTFMHNVAMMVAGRVLQGMTGALTWSVGLALVVDTVDPRRLGQAMGWMGAAMSWAALSAPLLGGIVFGKGGWYQVWAMCYALIAGDIVLRLVIIEKKDAKKWETADVEQAGASDDVAARAVSGGTRVDDQEKKQSSTQANDETRQSSGAVTGKIGVKSILPLFKNPRLLAALWACVIEASVQTAFDAIVPLEVESLFGWDSIGAGLIFFPFIIPTFLGPVVGWMGDRYGPKWLTTFGFFFMTPFLVCMRFVSEDTMAHKVMLCGLLFGVGVGICFTIGPLMAEITWSAKSARQVSDDQPEPIALAYALYNVAFSGGALIGPLLGGFIRDSAGFATVGWVLGIMTFVTGVTQLLWIGGPLELRRKESDAAEEGPTIMIPIE